MIVEDDEDLLENISLILESEGYEIIQASNGKIALDHLRQLSENERPNCIVLDLMMPVMDGKTFMETLIRESPDLARIPILIASARGHVDEDLVKLPSVKTIRKPFNIDVFLQTVEHQCGSIEER